LTGKAVGDLDVFAWFGSEQAGAKGVQDRSGRRYRPAATIVTMGAN
jgi:hypothetical protein